MEEKLREYILSGNTDEKQFIIENEIITVNPKKSQKQIEKEIKEEYQSVLDEENYMRVVLDNYYTSLLAEVSHDEAKMRERRETLSFLSLLPRRETPLLAGNYYTRSGVTTYFLLLFEKYLINFKRLVVSKGERGADQIENCLEMVEKIFVHLRKIQRRDILKTDRDLSIINENKIQIGTIPREELEDEPMYYIMSYILSDLKDNGFTFDYADRIIDFYNRVKDKKLKIFKMDLKK